MTLEVSISSYLFSMAGFEILEAAQSLAEPDECTQPSHTSVTRTQEGLKPKRRWKEEITLSSQDSCTVKLCQDSASLELSGEKIR